MHLGSPRLARPHKKPVCLPTCTGYPYRLMYQEQAVLARPPMFWHQACCCAEMPTYESAWSAIIRASPGHCLVADVAACASATGTLPASWSNMVRLKTLDLSDNRLTGAAQLKQCDAAPSA